MSVMMRAPQETPNFYQNEQKYLYDIPEVEEKTETCDCCGEDFPLNEINETEEDGFYCNDCYKRFIEPEEDE